ncbi:MAG: DNA-binding protein [Deltaproteobacteria bacterium]|nr:DNA-binding protein [Deltaproteobacteria bacterium]
MDGDRWARLWGLGDVGLLREKYLGLFCSTRCPGDVILKAYDTARALRDAGVAVIGGFHTPMEQECLDLLLRGTQPVVWCPARGLPNPRRLAAPRREALADGRLLILSPFSGQAKRVTAPLAELRNDLVSRLADQLLFLYAPSGSKTEALCKKVLAEDKTVLTLAGADCGNVRDAGALVIDLATVAPSC